MNNPLTCICCLSQNSLPKRVLRGYQTYQCSDCLFEFVSPIPSKEDIEKYYHKINVPEDVQTRIQKNIKALTNEQNHPKRDWFDKVLAMAQQSTGKQSLHILEIGSAYGYFIHYANSKNHHAVGTESTQSYAEASKGIINGEVKYVDGYNYNQLLTAKSDVVYMEHVFEHVLEPDKLLDGINTVLLRDGILIMSVPNSRGFLSLLLGRFWPWAVPPDHLYYYNEKALIKMLERKNLQIKEMSTSDYYFRSIPQFYSVVPIFNILIAVARKISGKKMTSMGYSYKYPWNVKEIFLLLPYWIFYPAIKLGSMLWGYNEIVVVATKK